MKIPSIDLSKQYLELESQLQESVFGVLRAGRFILGDQVRGFESEFSKYCGSEYGVAVASGTDALLLALLVCGIKQGDEVISCVHASVATIRAIELAGARPVLVDVNKDSYNLDIDQVASRLTGSTRAVIPIHLYGCPVEMDPLIDLAGQNNLYLIEDCAQAHGALYHGKKIGSLGDLAAFSFYPTKNLGAYGDAGMILTSRKGFADNLASLREYGWGRRYVSEVKGMNSRLDEIQAAILRVKLSHLERWNNRRRMLAGLYSRLLDGLQVGLPHEGRDMLHVYHQYVIRLKERDKLQKFLAENSIQTLIHYPLPIHLQPAFSDLGYTLGDFPRAELLSREILSLPMYPELSENAVEEICFAIQKFFSGAS